MKNKKSLFVMVLKRLSKKFNLKLIFLLAITLASNTFAWFVYSTKVSNSVTAYVRAWNVAFEVGTDDAVKDVFITIEDVYPGMDDFEEKIKAANHGDTAATLSYEIVSAKIFGTLYTISSDFTSEELAQKLAEEYPFKINVSVSNNIIEVGNTSEYYLISMVWPYESGNDELDTTWGNRAYDYYAEHPDEPSISLNIRILATQVNE